MKKGVVSYPLPAIREGHSGSCLVVRSFLWRVGAEGERGAAGRQGSHRPHAVAALALLSMLIFSACGFQPLHSEAYRAEQQIKLSSLQVMAVGSATENTSSVANNLGRRYSELLRAEIEDQVNPDGVGDEKLFTLSITFNELNAASFVKPDGTASRGDLNYTSTYTLTRIRDAKHVASGTIQRVSSYNASPSADYASYVSIEDARKRGILELAQDYKLRLAALLPKLNLADGSQVLTPPSEAFPVLQPMRYHETLRPGY